MVLKGRLRRLMVSSAIGLLLVTLLLLSLSSTMARAADPQSTLADVDPAVYQALTDSHDGLATFILYFGEQPDLTDADQIQDWGKRGEYVYAALRGAAERSQRGVMARVQRAEVAGRIASVRPYWIANIVVVRGDRTAVDAMAGLPGVRRILPELKIDPPEVPEQTDADVSAAYLAGIDSVVWGVQKIGAPTVWGTPFDSRGEGIVIGVVDTGVQWDHPALKAQYRGWDSATQTVDHDYNWFNPDPARTCDDSVTGTCAAQGHGTHVTGIVAGDDGASYQVGVAPGAKWIHALGCCPTNDALLAALQWMLAPTRRDGSDPVPALRPQVVNSSWGGPGGSLIFDDVIRAMHASGIVPVFSAGNSGSACATLNSPADNTTAFSVGGTGSIDQIGSWSSRGPNPFTRQIGPDVVAPGASILSSLPNNSYGLSSGTSMAAPHVSGAIALLLSAEPDLIGRVDEIEEILRRTATPLLSSQSCSGVPGSAVPNNTFGSGRIDVAAAVGLAWHAGTLTGVVRDASDARPLADTLVSVSAEGYTLTQRTGVDGSYSLQVGSRAYTVTAEVFGYAIGSQTAVSISQDITTQLDLDLVPLGRADITGFVREAGEASKPVAGAAVEVVGAAPPITALSSQDGAYELHDVPLGPAMLRMRSDGYATLASSVAVTGALVHDFAPQPVPDYVVGDGGSVCSAPFQWIDATGGTPYFLSDDAFAGPVSLPAPFSFYGNSYASVYIGSNGFVSFGQGYSKWSGVIPFEGIPNNVIYGLGDDLNPEGGSQGTVYSLALPDGRLVIEFHAIQHWSSGNPETFEIILNTTDNSIVIQYLEVSLPDFVNVGIENSDGTRGVEYSYANEPPITPGLAVKFTPFSGAKPDCVDFEKVIHLPVVLAGDLVTYTLSYYNPGPRVANGLRVKDFVPAGLISPSYVASGAPITSVGEMPFSWELASIAPGEGGTITFTAQVSADLHGGGTLTNSATISSTVDGTLPVASYSTSVALWYGPKAPVVAVARDSDGVFLSWQHVTPDLEYEVWTDMVPYFQAITGSARLLWSTPALTPTMGLTDATGWRDAAVNSFYAVFGKAGEERSVSSNRIGEFDYDLLSGS